MKQKRDPMKLKAFISTTLFILTGATLMAQDMGDHLFFKAAEAGIGQGKTVVFIAGDEEYKSEEALPMLAEIYAKNGFNATVLFSLDADGNVDQRAQTTRRNMRMLGCEQHTISTQSIQAYNRNGKGLDQICTFEKRLERVHGSIGLNPVLFDLSGFDQIRSDSFRFRHDMIRFDSNRCELIRFDSDSIRV